MRIRQRPFHRAFANADAEKAALLNGIGRIADLGARIDVGRQIAVDPPREMFGRIIGRKPAAHRNAADPGQKQKGRAGDEIHDAPGKQDQTGLPEIGLHRQQENDREHDAEGIEPPRRPAQILRGSHQPGAKDDETGLQKFRRLNRGKAQRIPAHRPLAKVGAQERQEKQGQEGTGKTDRPHAPHHLDRHHRGQKCRHNRHAAEKGLTADVIVGRQTVLFGQGNRGGQAQKQPKTEERDDQTQRPAVNRPPPAWQNRLTRPQGRGAEHHFRHQTALSLPRARFSGSVRQSSGWGGASPEKMIGDRSAGGTERNGAGAPWQPSLNRADPPPLSLWPKYPGGAGVEPPLLP